jgi:hypothetical protein
MTLATEPVGRKSKSLVDRPLEINSAAWSTLAKPR